MAHVHEHPVSPRNENRPPPASDRGRRPMHQSTLRLGGRPSESGYITTHANSFTGRGARGHQLRFSHRDPQFPSQHINSLDLRNTTAVKIQPHSRDVYGPKEIIPHHILHNLATRNKIRSEQGLAMREVTNPSEPTPYSTTYLTGHSHPVSSLAQTCPTGLPTHWHRHNILTGEEQNPAGPGRPVRRAGDRVLWATRRRETDCCALRLY